jgi:hypothetical protein
MTDISSKLDRAKVLATLYAERAAAASTATKERDTCLYQLLDSVHEIDSELRVMGKEKAQKILRAKYGSPWPKNPAQFLKLICPELPPKRRSKHAALLRYVRATKKPDRPLRKFVRLKGGINLTRAKQAHGGQMHDKPGKRSTGR